MGNNYRFDDRDLNTFKKDIKSSHVKEADIAVRICIDIYNKTKKWPSLEPTGTDMTGEYVSNQRNISYTPDFRINDIFTEITRSDVDCKRYFHQKSGKIDKYIVNKNTLVFVNNYLSDPKYIWLDTKQIEEFTQRAKSKYGSVLHPGSGHNKATNKSAYRYDIYWFDEQKLWQPLPKLIKSIPESYKVILNMVKV
jgi:hypothetical protein